MQWVLREYCGHAIVVICLIMSDNWLCLLINLPLLGYHIHRCISCLELTCALQRRLRPSCAVTTCPAPAVLHMEGAMVTHWIPVEHIFKPSLRSRSAVRLPRSACSCFPVASAPNTRARAPAWRLGVGAPNTCCWSATSRQILEPPEGHARCGYLRCHRSVQQGQHQLRHQRVLC